MSPRVVPHDENNDYTHTAEDLPELEPYSEPGGQYVFDGWTLELDPNILTPGVSIRFSADESYIVTLRAQWHWEMTPDDE